MIIIYVYHVLFNALNIHMKHINLNTIFCTHVSRAQSYQNSLHKVLFGNTHTHTHARTHACTHTHTRTHTHHNEFRYVCMTLIYVCLPGNQKPLAQMSWSTRLGHDTSRILQWSAATHPLVSSLLHSVCLSVCWHACSSLCQPACRSVCLHACPSVWMPVCLTVCMPVCLSECQSVWLSLCLSVCLAAYLMFVCLSACLSVCLPSCLFICLPVIMPVCLYVGLSVHMCMCVNKVYVPEQRLHRVTGYALQNRTWEGSGWEWHRTEAMLCE